MQGSDVYSETTVERYLDVCGRVQLIVVRREYLVVPPADRRIPTAVTYTTHDSFQHACKLLPDGCLANQCTGATYRPA